MSHPTVSLQRDLARLAIVLVATAFVLSGLAFITLNGNVRRDVLASLVAVLVAMLIGFIPLRLLLRAGPDKIVAAWIASMILRMLACLSGLVLLIKKYGVSPATCITVICGGYLLLLAIETVGLNRLIRRAFDQRIETKRNA